MANMHSLGRSLTSLIAAGATVAAPFAAAAATPAAAGTARLRSARPAVAAAPASVVQVNTGRGRLVTLSRPMSDLFISDDTIADVQVRSPTQLYLFGKKTGETTLSATNKAGQVVYATTVRVGQNYDSIGQMLALAMPEAKIAATPMNGLVLLTGTVAAPDDAAEAERLVQAYVGEGTKVLSRLKTATPLQVNLQVRIAEVSRGFVKNIGANLMTRDQTGGFNFGISSGRNPGSLTAADLSTYPRGRVPLPGGGYVEGAIDPTTGRIIDPRSTSVASIQQGPDRTTLGLAGRLLGLDVLSAFDLGETIGQVTTLANPNLTVMSGETASFLAGGELPIPLSQGLGAVSVEFKQFGISLSYTPTVLSDGRISMRVRPEVSQLSFDNAVTIGGTSVPGLTTRRVETTLELGSGQSMVIGGLLQNSHNNSIEKTPGLGNLPVLGALFRSNGFRRSETELVVVITPYLVRPVNNPGDIALPTDGYRAPTDLGRVLLGELEGKGSNAKRPVPTMAPPMTPAPSAGVVTPAPVTPSRSRSSKSDAAAPGFSN